MTRAAPPYAQPGRGEEWRHLAPLPTNGPDSTEEPGLAPVDKPGAPPGLLIF